MYINHCCVAAATRPQECRRLSSYSLVSRPPLSTARAGHPCNRPFKRAVWTILCKAVVPSRAPSMRKRLGPLWRPSKYARQSGFAFGQVPRQDPRRDLHLDPRRGPRSSSSERLPLPPIPSGESQSRLPRKLPPKSSSLPSSGSPLQRDPTRESPPKLPSKPPSSSFLRLAHQGPAVRRSDRKCAEEAVRGDRRVAGERRAGSRRLLRRLDAAGEAPPLGAIYGVGVPVLPPGRPPVQTAPLRLFRTLEINFCQSSLQNLTRLGRRLELHFSSTSPVLGRSNLVPTHKTLPRSSCLTVRQRTSGRSWRTLHVLHR